MTMSKKEAPVDFVDEVVEQRTEKNPAFPELVAKAEEARRVLPESEVDRLLSQDRQPICYCGANTKEECDAFLADESAFLEGYITTWKPIKTKEEKKP